MSKMEIYNLVAIYLVICVFLYVVTVISKNKFGDGALNMISESRGRYMQLTKDPCLFAVVGDPNAIKFIKLIVTCADGRSSWNTFDLGATNINNLKDLLLEFQRINGVSAELEDYLCIVNGATLDMNVKLDSMMTINCKYE